MRLFLVDFENVQGKGLLGIDKLKHNDEVVIFYSKNANKLSFDEMHLISASNAKIKYIEIETLGHNALDFNLVMYIGVIIGKFRGTHLDINIVSNDTGFDTLKNNQVFKSSTKYNFYRNGTIRTCDTKGSTKQKDLVEIILTKHALQKHAEISADVVETVTTKAELHNSLIQKLGKVEGLKVYTVIKPEFSKIKVNL